MAPSNMIKLTLTVTSNGSTNSQIAQETAKTFHLCASATGSAVPQITIGHGHDVTWEVFNGDIEQHVQIGEASTPPPNFETRVILHRDNQPNKWLYLMTSMTGTRVNDTVISSSDLIWLQPHDLISINDMIFHVDMELMEHEREESTVRFHFDGMNEKYDTMDDMDRKPREEQKSREEIKTNDSEITIDVPEHEEDDHDDDDDAKNKPVEMNFSSMVKSPSTSKFKVGSKQAMQELAKDTEKLLTQASDATAPSVLTSLSASPTGIDDATRAARLQEYGPNVLLTVRPPRWYHHLYTSVVHPFNMLLIGLAIIAIATGDFESFTVLMIIVAISVILRFIQERKAGISAEALKNRVVQRVRVRRPRIEGQHEIRVRGSLSVSHVIPDKKPAEQPVKPVPAISITKANTSGDFDDSMSSPTTGRSSRSQSKKDIELDSPKKQEYDVITVESSQLVPGDIVCLSAGSLVPADLRVMSSERLSVNQTILTGESLPVEKEHFRRFPAGEEFQQQDSVHFLKRANLCFMGSMVESGSGEGIVVTTGSRSYFGQNASKLVVPRPPSAFAVGVNRMSYVFIVVTAIMVPTVIVISGANQNDWTDAALFGAAVAVGLTPGMLPMIVNSNLALAASKMAKHKCVVKRLEAVPNIGAFTVLCTDKTGTLTQDRVTLHTTLDINGKPSNDTLNMATMIAAHQQGFRNVLDKAILQAGTSESNNGTYETNKIAELPFDFRRKRMSVVVTHGQDKQYFMLCKGALEQTLKQCTRYVTPTAEPTEGINHIFETCYTDHERVQVIDDSFRQQILNLSHELAHQGLRVLAVAGKKVKVSNPPPSDISKSFTYQDEQEFILLGFLTFLDAPKPDAATAIRDLHANNVNVKVLTGDNAAVTAQVCGQLGLPCGPESTLTGEQIATLSWDEDDLELQALFKRITVFSHLSPDDKAWIIRVLRRAGETVGFLGDGINDALALREADVGISVDTGADLAKDAADVILTEKDLDVLQRAVVMGRTTHGNTIKYIKMAASSNFGNVFSLLIAAAWLPFLPMQPIQLLVQNLLYDISQIGIPWDRMDADYIKTPKAWSARSTIWFIIFIGPISSFFDVTTFSIGMKYYGWNADEFDWAKRFQTLWFMEGLITQTLIVHLIRTERIPFVQSIADPRLILSSLLITIAAVAIPSISIFQDAFGMVQPPGSWYGLLAATNVTYFLLMLVAKKLYIWKFKTWL